MIALLSKIALNKYTIGAAAIGICVLSLWLYISHIKSVSEELRKDKEALESQIILLDEINKHNIVELEKIKKHYDLTSKALTDIKQITAERDKTISILKERVRNVRPENEGSIAPVMRDTLDELRARTSGDKDTDRAIVTTPGTVRVSSPAKSTSNR